MSDDEVREYRHALESGDGRTALKFIRDVLEEKVKTSELPHCVPVFDAGYNVGQADSFKKE
ncbi:MAG: hypothetical protein JJE48_03340 [Actinobacteria bacterium]|nr:hypothetical protein [Actinomycetota bacterium]